MLLNFMRHKGYLVNLQAPDAKKELWTWIYVDTDEGQKVDWRYTGFKNAGPMKKSQHKLAVKPLAIILDEFMQLYSGKVAPKKIIYCLEDGSFADRTKQNIEKFFTLSEKRKDMLRNQNFLVRDPLNDTYNPTKASIKHGI